MGCSRAPRSSLRTPLDTAIEIQLGDLDEAKEKVHGESDINQCDTNGVHKDPLRDMHDSMDMGICYRVPAPRSTFEMDARTIGVRALHGEVVMGLDRWGDGVRAPGVSATAVVLEGGSTMRFRLCDMLERRNAMRISQSNGLLGSSRPQSPDRGPVCYTHCMTQCV